MLFLFPGFGRDGNGRSVRVKYVSFMLVCAAALTTVQPALAEAPSGSIAKICREKAIAAHPTPKVGSSQGAATQQRDYFRDCVAKMQQEKKS
jgi:hypothetical protein